MSDSDVGGVVPLVSPESHGRLSFEYVRRYYGVPAKRGARVVWDGKPGRLTSGNGHYVRVLLDGERRPRIVHPTWHMVYEPLAAVSFTPDQSEELK
jgi:hypothetical protein